MKKRQMSKEPETNKKYIRERKFRVGFFMKIRLIIQGMIGARKVLDSPKDCPFMVCEYAKVKKFYYDMSLMGLKITQEEKISFNNYCALYDSKAADFQKLLNKLEKTIGECETVTIEIGLPDRINELLNVKRKSEQALDETALRIRRFNEYSNSLKPLREELKLLKAAIQDTYNMIVMCNSQIDIIDNQISEIIRKFCEYINLRIGWYWYGVFLKIKNSKLLNYHSIDMSDIEAKIAVNCALRDNKITEIHNRHIELMTKADCLSI